MAKAIINLPSLLPLFVEEIFTTNLSKKWEEWLDDFNIYLHATGITQAQQKVLLLLLAGKDVKEIYKILKTDDEEYNAVVDKLNNYFKPKVNVTCERYVFKQAKQGKDESLINFVIPLRSLAETSNFLNISEAVKDHFISSCGSMKLRRKFSREKELTLDTCIEIARNSEMAKIQAAEMANRSSEKEKTLPINATKTVDLTKHKRKKKQRNFSSVQNCFRCGEKYK